MSTDKDVNRQSAKQENGTSETIKSSESARLPNDANTNEEFPGYPHYPAKDDILNPDNNNGKLDIDLENSTKSPANTRSQATQTPPDLNKENVFGSDYNDDDLGIVEGTEADVTADDLMILEAVEGNIVRAKEEDLVTTDSISDINDEDLDLPGTELDDANESIGAEDEENNYYSLGGEREDP